MRLYNHFLVFDLEINKGWVFEFGGLILTPDLKVLDVIDIRFPVESWDDKIIELCNLTIGDISQHYEATKESRGWAEISHRISRWSIPFPKIRLVTWGGGDIPFMRKEVEREGLEWPFLTSCVDVRSLAFGWYALTGKRNDHYNLYNTVQAMKLESKDTIVKHRAVSDALYTAKIFAHCLSDLSQATYLPRQGKPWVRISLQEQAKRVEDPFLGDIGSIPPLGGSDQLE